MGEEEDTLAQWREAKEKFDKTYLEIKDKAEFSHEDIDPLEEGLLERIEEFNNAYKKACDCFDENGELDEDLADDVERAMGRVNRAIEMMK